MASLLRGILTKQGLRIPSNSHCAISPYRYAATSSVLQQAASATVSEIQIDDTTISGERLKSASEVPGPRRYRLGGSLLSLLMDKDFKYDKMHLYWRKLKKEYGSIVRLDLPGMKPMVLIYNPEDCEALARATMKNPVREGAEAIIKIRKNAIDDYFGDAPGIIVTNDDEWYRVRSRVQTPLMKPKNIYAYLTQMDEVTLDFLDRIAELQAKYGEMPSNFQTELYKWALESVGLITLNRRLGCLDPDLTKDSIPMMMINEANNMMYYAHKAEMGPKLWRFFPTRVYMKLKKSQDRFLKVADENIRATEEKLLAKDKYSEEELTLMETLLLTPGLTRKDVVGLILDMLFAGIDTTSHTVAFTLYLLAKNPESQTKLQEEIDSVLKDHEGPLTPQHLAKLTYLKAVLKESLRVFPLVNGTARTLEKDLVLSGYLIPKGFMVGSWNMYMSDDEELFPQAKDFIPERWMRDRPMGPIHPYASLPFGLGTRMCVGRRIAEQEIYTFLTRVMQRFNIDYHHQDMDITTTLVSVPSEPLRFSFTERR